MAKRDEPPDWVAVERAKAGHPVGRPLTATEKIELLLWSEEAGVGNAELAKRCQVSLDAVWKWRAVFGLPTPKNVLFQGSGNTGEKTTYHGA